MSDTKAVLCFMAAAVIGACGISGGVQAAGYYHDWYVNDNGVAIVKSNEDVSGNFLIFVPERDDAREHVRVEWKDDWCNVEDSGKETKLAWMVNGTYVKFSTSCSHRVDGYRVAYAVTPAGDQYIIKELIDATEVNINGDVYSAIGFNLAYDYLSISNYKNAL